MPDESPSDPVRRGRIHPAFQWILLVVLSLLFAIAIEWAGMPAAFLIGPMLAGVVTGARGAAIRVPTAAFAGAQAFAGVFIAASLMPDFFGSLAADWAVLLAFGAATVVGSSALGWLISAWKVLPGSTAIWGSAPGASTAMVLMAGAFGADERLVAFMQYLRVIMVSFGAALVAGLYFGGARGGPAAHDWLAAIELPGFATTLAVALIGAGLARLVRLPGPYFLGPFTLGAVLNVGFGFGFQIPEPMLAASYALIGWRIGLSFTGPILRHALKTLPQVIAAILALMAFCGMLAYLLHRFLGVDPLTAYLATSPGGMDSVAILAAGSEGVDLSFVMALQTLRFLMVLLIGPPIARFVARRVKP